MVYRKSWPFFLRIVPFVLMGFGILFLSITAHELYHVVTHWEPQSICYDFGSESIGHVTHLNAALLNMTSDEYDIYMNTTVMQEETRANTVSSVFFFGLYALAITSVLLSYRLVKTHGRKKEPPKIEHDDYVEVVHEGDVFDVRKW